MKHYTHFFIIGILAVSFAFSGPAFAQDGMRSTDDTRTNFTQTIKNRVQKFFGGSSDAQKGQETDRARTDVRTNTTDRMEAQREEARERAEETRHRLMNSGATSTMRSDATSTDARLRAQERANEMRDRAGERRVEIQARITNQIAERVEALATRMFRRLQAAIDRMEQLANRIESRIEKLEPLIGEQPEARAQLAEAREAIAEADETLRDARPRLGDVLEADNPRDTFTAMRELVREITASIRDAHSALVETVRLIKANIPEDQRGDDESDEEEGGENATNAEE